MSASRRTADRRAKLLSFCEGLPGVAVEPYGERHHAMKVRKKAFAYHLDDYHGDGRVAVCCKSTKARQAELVAAGLDRYFVPPYLGVSGWVALRVDGAKIDWDEAFDLLLAAYRLQAPKRLLEELE
jgi:hypothetical protein